MVCFDHEMFGNIPCLRHPAVNLESAGERLYYSIVTVNSRMGRIPDKRKAVKILINGLAIYDISNVFCNTFQTFG